MLPLGLYLVKWALVIALILYYILYNRQVFVAECCFICSTNLSLSYLYSLRDEHCSSSSPEATIRYLCGSTSLSGWRDGLARRDSMRFTGIRSQSPNQFPLVYMKLHYLNENFLYCTFQIQFRRQLISMTGVAYSKIHMYIFRVFTTDIILRARGIDYAVAEATAPCSLATYFGQVMPYVYNFIP